MQYIFWKIIPWYFLIISQSLQPIWISGICMWNMIFNQIYYQWFDCKWVGTPKVSSIMVANGNTQGRSFWDLPRHQPIQIWVHNATVDGNEVRNQPEVLRVEFPQARILYHEIIVETPHDVTDRLRTPHYHEYKHHKDQHPDELTR